MPFSLKINAPLGFALNAAKIGHQVSAMTQGETLSLDGEVFYRIVENFCNEIIFKLNSQYSSAYTPSQIDHMLVIFEDPNSCLVYVNELNLVGQIGVKRSTKAGDLITDNDIYDFKELVPQTRDGNKVIFEPNCGVFYLLSVGWLKGVFFDFDPLFSGQNRQFNLYRSFARTFSKLSFRHVFKIHGSTWDYLVKNEWVPFISLSPQLIKEIINYAENRWDFDEILLEKVASEVTNDLEQKSFDYSN